MRIVFLSLLFRRRHGLTSGNDDEYGWEISRYAHHLSYSMKRNRSLAIIHIPLSKDVYFDQDKKPL